LYNKGDLCDIESAVSSGFYLKLFSSEGFPYAAGYRAEETHAQQEKDNLEQASTQRNYRLTTDKPF